MQESYGTLGSTAQPLVAAKQVGAVQLTYMYAAMHYIMRHAKHAMLIKYVWLRDAAETSKVQGCVLLPRPAHQRTCTLVAQRQLARHAYAARIVSSHMRYDDAHCAPWQDACAVMQAMRQ